MDERGEVVVHGGGELLMLDSLLLRMLHAAFSALFCLSLFLYPPAFSTIFYA